MDFSDDAVLRIADLLGATPMVEPYRVRGEAVYRLTVQNPALGADLAIILWPSLARVDLRVGDSAIVFKGVDDVLLFPGVEVMFRRAAPAASLFISVGGRFGMTA
jgi:hypothetical protein